MCLDLWAWQGSSEFNKSSTTFCLTVALLKLGRFSRREQHCVGFGGWLQKGSHWKMLSMGDLFCCPLVLLPALG